MPKILRNYILGYKKVKGKIVFFVEISKFMTSTQKLKGKIVSVEKGDFRRKDVDNVDNSVYKSFLP